MKKAVICIAVLFLASAVWFFTQRSRSVQKNQEGAGPGQALAERQPALEKTPSSPPPAPSPAPATVASDQTDLVSETKPASSTAGDESPLFPQMTLLEVMRPNNGFHDPLFGVSLTYPGGWSVRDARRWGPDNHQNTVFFHAPAGSRAYPSMYYQNYSEDTPSGNAGAYLREIARKKEASRSSAGVADYRNDPASFVDREIAGNPALSYSATYTRDGESYMEYFTRILGPKGYVMFFVNGPAKDVQALIPAVDEMSATVTTP